MSVREQLSQLCTSLSGSGSVATSSDNFGITNSLFFYFFIWISHFVSSILVHIPIYLTVSNCFFFQQTPQQTETLRLGPEVSPYSTERLRQSHQVPQTRGRHTVADRPQGGIGHCSTDVEVRHVLQIVLRRRSQIRCHSRRCIQRRSSQGRKKRSNHRMPGRGLHRIGTHQER